MELIFFFAILVIAVFRVRSFSEWVDFFKTRHEPVEPVTIDTLTFKIDYKYIVFTKKEYLASPQWKALRQVILKRDNHKCQLCSSSFDLVIHHTNYQNYMNEKPTDLVTLCQSCHSHLHSILGYKHTTFFSLIRYKIALKKR